MQNYNSYFLKDFPTDFYIHRVLSKALNTGAGLGALHAISNSQHESMLQDSMLALAG